MREGLRVRCGVFLFTMAVLCFTARAGFGAEVQLKTPADALSLKNEVQHAAEKGLRWLASHQDPKGFWSQPDYPALTGLVLTAFMEDPAGHMRANPPEEVKKGYAYLLSCVQPDGGIYVKGLSNYNTSVGIMALLSAYNPAYEPTLRKARSFLVGLQTDAGEKGKPDDLYDGGIGYGDRYQHSDMSNTLFALEALHYTKALATDKADPDAKDLNWQAVVTFIQRCQNLPGFNDQAWASDDPQNKGGFIYFPGDSKAGEMQLPSGRTALRSYGSISYAGLLSYIYAEVDKNDPRVKAVYEWLARNYTLDENPGMGQQGLFYYYHTMAKALTAYGTDKLVLADGKEIDWKKDLALRLLNLQQPDGSWVNENGRFWEKDPVLVTAYGCIVMEILYRAL